MHMQSIYFGETTISKQVMEGICYDIV